MLERIYFMWGQLLHVVLLRLLRDRSKFEEKSRESIEKNSTFTRRREFDITRRP